MKKSKIKNQKSTDSGNASSASSGPQTMDELLASLNYSITPPKRGDEIEGTIISISPRQLLLDIGGKSEGTVHEKEMPLIGDYLKSLNVGDKVKAHVVHTENDLGQVVVSLRKTALSQRWENLAEKMKSEEDVEVTIKEQGKGGYLVDFMGLRGFVPLSQADQELVKSGEKVLGKKIRVKIIEAQPETNRLIFSQQTSGGLSDKQKSALKSVEVGMTVKAEVTGVVQFGAFTKVRLDDETTLPGLVHISEIAWEKVENPIDYLQVGKTIDVKVIGVDAKSGKLTLSIKQLVSDPWEDVAKVFSVEQTVKGKVTRITPYGVFVSLLPGIEGLVHISKISPGEEPKIGSEVDCMIEDISPEKRKISLSLVSYSKPVGYK